MVNLPSICRLTVELLKKFRARRLTLNNRFYSRVPDISVFELLCNKKSRFYQSSSVDVDERSERKVCFETFTCTQPRTPLRYSPPPFLLLLASVTMEHFHRDPRRSSEILGGGIIGCTICHYSCSKIFKIAFFQ